MNYIERFIKKYKLEKTTDLDQKIYPFYNDCTVYYKASTGDIFRITLNGIYINPTSEPGNWQPVYVEIFP